MSGGSQLGRGGAAIVRADWAATAIFAVSSVGAVAVPRLRGPATAVSLALFVLGTAVFVVALVMAAGRSRTHEMGIGGLFFLAGGTAPAGARRHLMTALAVQVVVGLATASARPFTSQAFAILVPVFGLGMAGLWGARHGSFGPRSSSG